jgi:hypothetical protein
MSYEYESSMGQTLPTSVRRLAISPTALRRLRPVKTDEAAAPAFSWPTFNGGAPANGAPPADNGYVAPGDEGALTVAEETGTPTALWVALGAIILGGGGFIAYKLLKGKKPKPPAPPEMP